MLPRLKEKLRRLKVKLMQQKRSLLRQKLKLPSPQAILQLTKPKQLSSRQRKPSLRKLRLAQKRQKLRLMKLKPR